MAMIGLRSQDCGTLALIFATYLLLNGDNALALQGFVFCGSVIAHEWMCLWIEI